MDLVIKVTLTKDLTEDLTDAALEALKVDLEADLMADLMADLEADLEADLTADLEILNATLTLFFHMLILLLHFVEFDCIVLSNEEHDLRGLLNNNMQYFQLIQLSNCLFQLFQMFPGFLYPVIPGLLH